ncbi:hypothetical protein VT84_03995 [Gemmata sp. SH-PL17]|nr:hypothetical protein VT84_03995 [Gemmata sp. SH-PL17]
MLPQRSSGSIAHPVNRVIGVGAPAPSYEAVKRRVLAKLEDRLDMSASKRMPQSLLRQSLRQHAEQITDQEARGFAKADRDRLIDESLAEILGFGPLEELFNDVNVREVMLTGPGTVIARREHGQWLPTSVKFRDEAHVRATLDRIATHAEPIGPVMTSIALFDMRLPNGFRAIAVIPPEALDQPATASFLRESPLPGGMLPKDASGAFPGLPATGSTSQGTLKTVSAPTTPPRSNSGTTLLPGTRVPSEPPASGISDPLARHRVRILERLLSKFAALKVYDVTRLEITELRKIVSAYIREYGESEKVYLSDTDQGRIMLEILTSLQR